MDKKGSGRAANPVRLKKWIREEKKMKKLREKHKSVKRGMILIAIGVV